MGCSPDRYIRTTQQGGAEVKTLEQHLMVKLLLNPDVPVQHLPQIYGCMLVTGAEWWDFVAYCPGFQLYKKRLFRDHAYIETLEAGLRQFTRELADIVQKVTGETLVTHRKRQAKRFSEVVAEETNGGGNEEVAARPAVAGDGDGSVRPTRGLVSDLQASLAETPIVIGAAE